MMRLNSQSHTFELDLLATFTCLLVPHFFISLSLSLSQIHSKWRAKNLGFEKIIMKNLKLVYQNFFYHKR